jgi:CheY-like chemotaxis protein
LRVQGVLTDVRLGTGANGLQLARAIRARWPGLHVLLMSGELPEFEGRDPVAANLDDDSVPFLQKPFTIAQVIPWLQALPEAGTA